MEVITFSPDMDLSSKEAGDVFRLKLYGIEYDVKVVGDDEDPLMFCKDCIFFFNNSERCLLSESQDWCIEKEVDRSVSGYIFFGPEDLKEFEKEIIERNPNSGYDPAILLNMYLTLAFVKEFGFKAGEAWSEIIEYAYGCLSYSDFATTETLIPEGSEYLFNDVHTAEADELYHHVLDKFGWAWRDPKYKSETELCAMLKWAKEKGLTIEELSI